MKRVNCKTWLTALSAAVCWSCGEPAVDTQDVAPLPSASQGAVGNASTSGTTGTDETGAASGQAGTSAGTGVGTGMGMGAAPATAAGSDSGASPGSVSDASGMAGGVSASAQSEGPPAGARPGLAARLSKQEYRYSILDVLGVALTDAELDAAAGGIPDDTGDGVFKHFADKQISIEQHALAYFQVAKAVAGRTDLAALAAEHAVCTDATLACGRAAIESVGERLFRRPLDTRELEAFSALFASALDEGEDFPGALRTTLSALLQSPQFVFRLEGETTGTPGTDRALTGYELAARLAAFIWVSVPDATLLELAASGALTDPAELQNQVTRMLADAKAERLTETFIADFSRAQLASFTGATDEDRRALSESVSATFQHHFWQQGRSVAELFTTTEFLVNARVAELLGVPYSGPGLELVDVASLPERVGLFAHPGMIAGMGDLEVGSFVNRGKVLMERLLCRNPIAVPAALLEELEEFNQDTTGLNEHERAAIRMTRPECWGCHSQFEPLAFGFSRFDGAGRYVGEVDAEGKPLPLDGWVPVNGQDQSLGYTNFAEYMTILAGEGLVQQCMTEHFLAFASARGTDELAKEHAEGVSTAYVAEGSTLSAMVDAVVLTDLFRKIKTYDPTATEN